MWETWIHNTRSGSPERKIQVATSSWNRRLGSLGSATHGLQVRHSGLSNALINELRRGNKYSIAQRWGTHCAYAGVIKDDGAPDGSPILPLRSKELRAALFPGRAVHGVNEYTPGGVLLKITNRSWAGAYRSVLDKATKGGIVPGWELPIDLPADAAGGFNAEWLFEEGLSAEDMTKQIEQDGAETDLAPYITPDGYLRYQAKAAEEILVGTPMLVAARAPGAIVTHLEPKHDSASYLTGVLAFGNGSGEDRLWAFSPQSGIDGIRDMPVQDAQVTFPDIYDQTRLQRAADAEFRRRNKEIEQWSVGLFIGRTGPQIADVGRQMDVHVYSSQTIPSGVQKLRSIGLSGSLSHYVTPEVQSYD